ncbi:MAG: hypothetical protein A2W90_06160 [Bacteroidetes bacterium GWF2_42_66]|nr:MAG: hypothetical protein A2W89_04015 [Bacteroidetes bacterium GWE2_42_39]OFY46137.1 MAG: hypothetical protein A2W90_06160 [Bacteroidetes bacterium GWF2_42_66]HBL75644.1 hypothetical protein [Prolixibacteraceae bacterium]HCR91139.1 hypothetical protein [Prolixibacteraceae bacterium]HCU61377.1 hypothetical protein [Prolixibacteraceae bacterium]
MLTSATHLPTLPASLKKRKTEHEMTIATQNYTVMKRIIYLSLLLLLCTTSIFAQAIYLGLGHLKTSDLTIVGENLYASTNNGIFRKNISSTDTLWTPCGMQGVYVLQTIVKNPTTFISVVFDGVTKYLDIKKTIDGGNSFSVLLSGDKEFKAALFLDHLAHPSNNYDTFYSLYHRMKTFDGGITWTPIKDYLGGRFVKFHPEFGNQIFTGGEDLTRTAELKYSADSGNNFKRINMTSFFAGDNAIYDIEFVGNRWIGVGEAVIAYTDDSGENWVQVWNSWADNSTFSMYIFDIEKSLNGQLYASGTTYFNNRIGLFSSATNGQTWDTISFQCVDRINPEIKCIALNSVNKTDNIYFGGNGIYLYTKIITGISKTLTVDNDIMIFPNPSSSTLYCKSTELFDNVCLMDISGRILKAYKPNSKEFSMDISSFGKGIYLLQLKNDNGNYSKKIIIR